LVHTGVLRLGRRAIRMIVRSPGPVRRRCRASPNTPRPCRTTRGFAQTPSANTTGAGGSLPRRLPCAFLGESLEINGRRTLIIVADFIYKTLARVGDAVISRKAAFVLRAVGFKGARCVPIHRLARVMVLCSQSIARAGAARPCC